MLYPSAQLILRKLFSWKVLVFSLLFLSWQTYRHWPELIVVKGESPQDQVYILMPRKDKERLNFFLREICLSEAGAYTLIGCKPMSWHVFEKPSVNFFRLFQSSYLKLFFYCDSFAELIFKVRSLFYFCNYNSKLGWETLQKYQHYLPNSRFLILESPLRDRGDYFDLFIIDKILFKQVVREHLSDFRSLLQNDSLDPDFLLEEMKTRPVFDVLQNNEVLLAILFGFGKGNGIYYEQCRQNMTQPKSPWSEESDSENLAIKNKSYFSFQSSKCSELYYPRFVAIPDSDETKKLVQIYTGAREKILKYYEDKDFVEATLSLLNQKEEPPFDSSESTTFWKRVHVKQR